VVQRQTSLLVDTDIFIDYLNSAQFYLLAKYANHGLRKGDALVAATAWSRTLPLLTRNIRHYRFISEINLIGPAEL
jgi:predicted nucleic acid-binding protein